MIYISKNSTNSFGLEFPNFPTDYTYFMFVFTFEGTLTQEPRYWFFEDPVCNNRTNVFELVESDSASQISEVNPINLPIGQWRYEVYASDSPISLGSPENLGIFLQEGRMVVAGVTTVETVYVGTQTQEYTPNVYD
jgi:hypothetical protein